MRPVPSRPKPPAAARSLCPGGPPVMNPLNPHPVAALARPYAEPFDLAPAAPGLRPAPIVSEFTQLALWMAASLAGLVTALLVAREPFFRSLARRMGWLPREA